MESEKSHLYLKESKVGVARFVIILAAFGVIGTIEPMTDHLFPSLWVLIICIVIILLFKRKALQPSIFDGEDSSII